MRTLTFDQSPQSANRQKQSDLHYLIPGLITTVVDSIGLFSQVGVSPFRLAMVNLYFSNLSSKSRNLLYGLSLPSQHHQGQLTKGVTEKDK